MELLKETIAKIDSLDEKKMDEAQARLDSLTKPPGSLGKLEEIAIKLAGITEDLFAKVDQKVHVVMAGDHGVVEEGVSTVPQAVTTQMVYNFLNEGAAVNALANQVGAEVTIVDIGVASEIESEKLVVKKVKPGTNNLAKGPAMTKQEAIASIEAGIEVVQDLIDNGANLIGTGEMGIGNTTPSSAILTIMTDLSLDETVGYGTGINDEQLKKKKEIIKEALEVNQPQEDDALDILAKVGGLEIGGIAGVMLGATANQTPVMIDGLISGAAALIAQKLEPQVTNYLIPSHKSVEPGHIRMYELLGLEPMLDMDMRLGEGTGAVLGMNLVEAATRIINDMATLEEAEVEANKAG
ncbi:nicotinate-nucleotide--dimethylbenzimidazole phosphoribosyltransferase [Selenihalanaerobacter shriftii]|uniref:Nicotinate-nucleotide--dimethylbenzimidazole phosphoribosyltransferase n=1 Tax=Selenihalanaerobacter shriftii TaxID=142842 RepID=A0A1T4JZU4_9FIRM|nr:nicotinate-nucleotide--dimethylbenzimidazole phosphoribosyltransferase [Selenihalanaerobacter shriftii]SJZ35772.1 nicotinate-nucleotide-dimethylbenzimidazole phosphoribosyltransferase [Selenihalanaerobacter shriftii]